MEVTANNIKEIYDGKVADRYDVSMSHFFANLKEKAYNHANFNKGDTVLVFCCGTGLDFSHIKKRIGNEGKIIGIDFSSRMLSIAHRRIKKNNWGNIKMLEADITEPEIYLNEPADIGVCTLGMSIIPDFKLAYTNLLGNVKSKGEIVIGDMQLATGWKSIFNPLTITMAKRYGGSTYGHQNSLELQEMMRNDLENFTKKNFFLGSYYFCLGRKKG